MTREASVGAGPFPMRLTSFVGRVTELRELHERLDRQRLVTLVGPGGVGKTRLAVEAARTWDRGPRWYVDLAGVEGAVDSALAVATGALEGPSEDPLRAVARRIGAATALVLVDNCDPVVDECAAAVDALLRSCPGLTVFATSREPLRVEGETVVRLPPLSLPSEEGLDGDAVLLFLERARLRPECGLRDRDGIGEICRRLDGMPLAIELAAARAEALSVPDILTGLSSRFRLLADGPRTADRRQRSLAASILWSYRLLSPVEARVLQRLAVFSTAFTAQAAMSVVHGPGVERSEVLSVLARLIEKSFVVVDGRRDESRYRLLETIREYAAERLEIEPSEAAATRDRHLRYLRETAERMEAVFHRQPPLQWIDRFESELPDIRAAVTWAAQRGAADEALRLVGSLSRFWWVRARADGASIIDQALAIDGGASRWRAHALTAATLAALARHDPNALRLGQAAVRSADGCDDPAIAARAHCWLGWTYLYTDLPRAQPDLDQACELARAADPWTLATALNGLVGTQVGRSLPSALEKSRKARDLAASQDNQVDVCCACLWMALISLAQGRLTAVDLHGAHALSLAESMGAIVYSGESRILLASSAVMRGDDLAARVHIEALQRLAGLSANPVLMEYAAAAEALADLVDQGGEAAREPLRQAVPSTSLFGKVMYATWISDILTDAALDCGELAEARAHAARAARFAIAVDNGWARSRARLASARVDAYAADDQAAGQEVHKAIEQARRNDDSMTTLEGLELLASIELRQQSLTQAVRLTAAAAACRSRLEYTKPLTGPARAGELVDRLRSRLGTADFEDGWAEGSELSLDDAVALARRRRGRRRPATGWDSLTPAERRVVGLVGEGLTNPQIAAKLFVTVDTVKGHVSAAFRKLGVTSRAELAADAARRRRG